MPSDQLETHLRSLDGAVPFQTAWSVIDLRTGQRWSSNGGVCVPAASTRKIAILMACLQEVHAGVLKLDEKIQIEARRRQNDSGVLRFCLSKREALVCDRGLHSSQSCCHARRERRPGSSSRPHCYCGLLLLEAFGGLEAVTVSSGQPRIASAMQMSGHGGQACRSDQGGLKPFSRARSSGCSAQSGREKDAAVPAVFPGAP